MIIGIVGKKQSGKDTVCKIIQYISWLKASGLYGEVAPNAKHFTAIQANKETAPILSVWEKHSWAEKLKECASIILGCEVTNFESEFFKESFTSLPLSNKEGEPMTHREFLQILGTEVGRAIDSELWVKVMMSKYEREFDRVTSYGEDEQGHLVVTHLNMIEPFWIMPDTRFPNEARTILDKEGILIKVNRDTGLTDNHISEHALDDFNEYQYVIDNNGTLDDLIKNVSLIMEDIECQKKSEE